MAKKREITQIVAVPAQTGSGSLVALASDGTLWATVYNPAGIKWEQIDTTGVDTKNDYFPTPP